jgi:GT2 family glycosyltransferase
VSAAHPQRRDLEASIVIPLLNGEATIGQTLGALLSEVEGRPVEIIVADNGSTDGSANVVRALAEVHSCIQLVDGSQELGGAHARNAGAAEGSSRLLIFVDDDDMVEPGWLNAMLAAATDECLLAGPVDEWKLAAHPTWQARTSRTRPPMTIRGQVFATSANLAISRALFDRVGGFKPVEAGVGGEDVELSWRVESLGCPITFVPGAVVLKRPKATRLAMFRQWHRYGRSIPALQRDYPEKARHNVRNAPGPASSGETLREVARCLFHPVANQGVYIQMAGLATGALVKRARMFVTTDQAPAVPRRLP